MLENFTNPFRVTELRNRLLFTFAMLAVFRVGCFIPTPGVDLEALGGFLKGFEKTVVGFLSLFSGGAFRKFSIFSLGIMPYISASIIIQLLTVVVPYLDRLQKEGEQGRKKITQYTRYGTIVISVIQSMGLSFWLQGMGARYEAPVVPNPGLGFVLMTVITLTTGTAFLMWLGEQISERGIGNGISLIIFAGIVAVIPSAVYKTFVKFVDQGFSGLYVMLPIIAIIVLGTAAVVIMLQAQRKIPVQYAKRVVGRKIYGGQATHIPLQINPAGVIPVIFASSILAFPATFSAFFGGENRIMQTIQRLFEDGSLTYCIIFFILTIFFVYFYTAIVFNPVDIAENMRKWGGFIPGIRPGRATASYIEKVLSRILLTGAIFLGLIAILPYVLIKGLDLPFFFGGTSLLIVVGVDLDTMKQIESHMLMRHYEGFMKKGKIKARF